MEKLKGSMEALSAMQITTDMDGSDIRCKSLLFYAEILAVILRDTVAEYKGYSWKEVKEFIEDKTITSTTEVSPGRTNTKIRADNTEFFHLNEKTTHFDLAFRAKNPLLSTEDIQINLHIDVEPQKTYNPGYPVEKRGMYYLARRLSSQLSLITQGTDYNLLTKCYSIWICRDDILAEDRYSISVYETVNTKNTAINTVARENYDLMTLVVIKLGNKRYNGNKDDEGYDLLRFLNAIMYPHKEDFMDTVSEYIDYSDNEKLWEEVKDLGTLEEIICEGIREEVTERIREEVTEKVREEVEEKVREEVEEKVREEVEEKVREEVEEKVREEVEEKVREEVEEKVREEITKRAREKVREEGIQILMQENLEENIPREKIIIKIQKYFNLTEEEAEQYYKRFV